MPVCRQAGPFYPRSKSATQILTKKIHVFRVPKALHKFQQKNPCQSAMPVCRQAGRFYPRSKSATKISYQQKSMYSAFQKLYTNFNKKICVNPHNPFYPHSKSALQTQIKKSAFLNPKNLILLTCLPAGRFLNPS